MLVKIELTIDTEKPSDRQQIEDTIGKLNTLLEMVDDYMYEPEPQPVQRKPYPKKKTTRKT